MTHADARVTHDAQPATPFMHALQVVETLTHNVCGYEYEVLCMDPIVLIVKGLFPHDKFFSFFF